MIKPQFIYDENNLPLFAVIHYQEYQLLISQIDNAEVEIANIVHRYIPLPYGGPGAQLDILKLIEFFNREDTLEIPINIRAQRYDQFPENQRNTLDPFIRREILGLDSPYKNTMQATKELIADLISTGLFEHCKTKHPAFQRSVSALRIKNTEANEFMKKELA